MKEYRTLRLISPGVLPRPPPVHADFGLRNTATLIAPSFASLRPLPVDSRSPGKPTLQESSNAEAADNAEKDFLGLKKPILAFRKKEPWFLSAFSAASALKLFSSEEPRTGLPARPLPLAACGCRICASNKKQGRNGREPADRARPQSDRRILSAASYPETVALRVRPARRFPAG
jgi:hypothetical protein